MERILIVAATTAEIAPLLTYASGKSKQVDFLVTGVGMVATAFALGKKLAQERYDLAINLGIAGAFNRDLTLGEIVSVTEDSFSELGAEDGDLFLPITQMGFGKNEQESIISDGAASFLAGCKQVKGITVNTVHGNEQHIEQIQKIWPADVESMEGAAFYYACEQADLPCIQIRSISNYVERRDREKWKIGLAIANLNNWMISKMTF